MQSGDLAPRLITCIGGSERSVDARLRSVGLPILVDLGHAPLMVVRNQDVATPGASLLVHFAEMLNLVQPVDEGCRPVESRQCIERAAVGRESIMCAVAGDGAFNLA